MDLKIALILNTLVLIAGCSTSSVSPQNTTSSPTDATSAQLAEVASSVDHSLNSLAAIEQAASPQAKVQTPPNPESYGMEQVANIDWAGPVEPLVRKIGAATGYTVKVIGSPPSQSVLVTIAANNTALGDILRDVGFQCGKFANIVVFPATRVIELRYAKS